MTIREICKLIFDGLFTAIVHVIFAFVLSLTFFKIVFYFYQLDGFTIAAREQTICIFAGMGFLIGLKVFLTLPLSSR